LKIFNTLTKKKESFNLPDKKVRMFVCGPTVYDYPHIGHARTYIMFDVVAKYLRHEGYDVFYLQNITDIDDKIIARAKEQGREIKELTEEFEKIYMEDMVALGINSVDKYARATEHISEIVAQVKKLIDKGHAYKIDPSAELRTSGLASSDGAGGYYFDLSTFEDYGKLSGRTAAQAEDSVSRIDESVGKRNKGDFVLWKLSKEGESGWESELGYGRPGWHIEDTAISEKYLGDQYEIHCGAQDLMFPHHESEIAQQEAASGKKPFVKYWLHSGLLTVEGKKMSKSLGNFVTIRDILEKYPAEAVRMMFLMSNYRSPVDYSEQNLKQAEAAVQRISEFVNRLNLSSSPGDSGLDRIILNDSKEQFEKEMDDDFNTPKAVAVIFDLIKKINPMIDEGKISKDDAEITLGILNEFNDVLGVVPAEYSSVPDEIKKLAKEREELRKDKKFEEADKARDELKEKGFKVEDTEWGPLIKKIK